VNGIGIVPTSVPRLALGAMLRHDGVRGQDLLLLPERMVKLNESGAAILGLCDGRRSVAEITEELERRFEATGLAADVLEFLTTFAEHGWVKA
jgi:pyrroloquinoline quinone biosynthesis protein D